MRSTATRPAPRSMRAFEVCAITCWPVPRAIREASSRGLARNSLVAKQQQRLLAGGEDRGNGVDHRLIDRLAFRDRRHGRDRPALAPGGIGGQDQRGDLPRCGLRGGDRLGAVGGRLPWRSARSSSRANIAAPASRYRR